MTRDEMALKIGTQILDAFARWEKSPQGKSITIPVKMPKQSNRPDLYLDITLSSPWFIETYVENGEYKSKYWTMEKWMGWVK